MKIIAKLISRSIVAMSFCAVTIAGAYASDSALLDKASSGGKIRIGFANEAPWGYAGENNQPLGLVNAIALGTLKTMGIENIEPVPTDWGGLIPGLVANRYDLVTGGMYIQKARCRNMDFSDPIGTFGDVFVVPKGNPKKLETYEDVVKSNATLVTGIGYNIVDIAKKQGVPEANIMQVPGTSEMLAALLAGRADAIALNMLAGQNLVEKSGDKAELTDTTKMPEWTMNWVGIGFRKADKEFLKAYNIAQAKYIGTDEMLASVAKYGYTKQNLPEKVTTAYACENR